MVKQRLSIAINESRQMCDLGSKDLFYLKTEQLNPVIG